MSRKKFAEMGAAERGDLAKGISALREALDMTQEQLAKSAGVSRQSISNIERGESVPSGKNLAKLMKALGVDEAPEFDVQTEKWLVLMGALAESVPMHRRQRAMDAAQQYLTLSVAADIQDFALAASVDDYDEESAANQVQP